MKTTIRYILLCALQDRLFYGLLALILSVAGISYALGGTAFLENQEMVMTFTASVCQIVLVVTAIVFVCFYVKSSFDHKHMDVMLSRPLSRDHIVLSHWLGFAVICVLMVLPVSIILALIEASDLLGLVWWSATIVLELWIVVAFSLFASLIMRSAVVSVLASLAFYVLSQMMILFVMTAERSSGAMGIPMLADVLEWISMVVPRIDLFGKSEWLVYGLQGGGYISLIIMQTILYVSVLLVMCVLDFRKKQF